MCSLKEREDQLTSLEAELSQLTEELDKMKKAHDGADYIRCTKCAYCTSPTVDIHHVAFCYLKCTLNMSSYIVNLLL